MATLLFNSILPREETKERIEIFNKTTLKTNNNSIRTQNTKFGQLILMIAQETAEAILENQYRKFDALIKNFGCQITALEVQQLLKKPDIRQEAESVSEITSRILKTVNPSAPLKFTKKMNLIEYINSSGLNFTVSFEFLRLVRFRLLCIVNDNKLNDKGDEVPFTNMDLFSKKIKKLNFPVEDFIAGLQAEESFNASQFIKNQVRELTIADTSRAPLLQRLLDASFIRVNQPHKRYSSIMSTPLLYNTETVFRRTMGLVLIKNKLTLLGKPIENALSLKVFFEFPAQKLVTSEELAKYSNEEPILVVEGYVKTSDLVIKINEIGFMTIINTNSAIVPQYASKTNQSPFGDEEADQDVAKYQSMNSIINDIIKIDHIYCASLGEEK
ncbi:MAG: hypothetical protein Q8K60_07600 [Parachlamydiaceae bacterium]|nr:hypothetical protein [Parachlamydiaceae bacterium]